MRAGRGARGSRRARDGEEVPLEEAPAASAADADTSEGRGRRARHTRDAPSAGRARSSRAKSGQPAAVNGTVAAVGAAQQAPVLPVTATPVSVPAVPAARVQQAAAGAPEYEWPPASEQPSVPASKSVALSTSDVAGQQRASSLSAALDPLATGRVASPERMVSAITRPHTAAAQAEDHLQTGVLANGIPALPADLSLDTPAMGTRSSSHQQQQQPQQQQPIPVAPGVDFSFPQQRAQGQVAGFPAPAFGGLIWSQAPGAGGSLWQPPPPPPPQHADQQQQYAPPQMQQAPQRAPSQRQLDAFYSTAPQVGYSAGRAFAGGVAQEAQRPMQAPQFGSFSGSFGQGQNSHFGGFGQTAFVPTGKQPDWSVPSNLLQSQSSGAQAAGSGQGFPLGSRPSTALDSIWQTPDTGGRYSPSIGSSAMGGQLVGGGSTASMQQVRL